jgi:hypothetical protein
MFDGRSEGLGGNNKERVESKSLLTIWPYLWPYEFGLIQMSSREPDCEDKLMAHLLNDALLVCGRGGAARRKLMCARSN